jgi:hypothetical protein
MIGPASQPVRSATSRPAVEHIAAEPYRISIYIACTVLAIVTNYFLGKEMAWDTLNYHLYAGFSAVNDRFSQDYFAAGPQAYFNPFVYVPFYELIRSGMPALAIGTALAVVHSAILWLTYELAISVCPSDDRGTRLMFGIYAVILAYVNPILMQEIGTSFADITTAELVLASWLLLLATIRAPSTTKFVCAGLILGAATAFKLTNAVHAISAVGILIMLPVSLRSRMRSGLIYGTSLGFGFAVVALPWSYRLERFFGNPVFPLMNNVFRSPEFTTEPLRHFRFVPQTIAEALWRPFAMIDPTSMVHEELRAPDSRYAVLAVLITALFIRWLVRRAAHAPSQSMSAEIASSSRVLSALGCGLAVDWVLWLSGSGNSRYFLPMACVAAVVVVGLLFHLFAKRPKLRNYVLAAILGTQAIQLWMGTDYRWNGVPWGGRWFDVAVPDVLRTQPNLYLTIGTQSNSFVAPFLARGAGLVNFSGGYALGSDGANGDRIKALIQRYAPRVRVLVAGAKLYEDAALRAPRRAHVDDVLRRFGFRTDMNDCETITVHGLPPALEIRIKTAAPIEPEPRDSTSLVSCHVVPDDTGVSARAARQHAVDLVLDRLEDACPELFQPRRLLTEQDGAAWQRHYMNTDLAAWVSYGWVKFSNPVRSGDRLVFLGRESDWAKAPLHVECGRRNGSYFAHIVD